MHFSNVNRVATCNTLSGALDQLCRVAGLVIQAHRAYRGPSKQRRWFTQAALARRARVWKTEISQLERGCGIPRDEKLRRIMHACGMKTSKGSAGRAWFEILRTIRINAAAARRLAKETPG